MSKSFKVVLGIGIFIVYWSSVHPGLVRKGCHSQAIERAREDFWEEKLSTAIYITDLVAREADMQQKTKGRTEYREQAYAKYYQECIREKGL